ncbi:hypothetical protein ACFRI7_07540 [Streptomyces sp. NPDC056716]|uniref:Rv1733c family protein n=1 Tax=unclassified Streptomyces TaxID=2593676 RepID=UPI0036AC8A76
MNGTNRWLWRWRSSPLRRPEDLVEAWIVLLVWLVMAVGGATAAAVTVRGAEAALDQQRTLLQPVRAVLGTDAPRVFDATGQTGALAQGQVRWTAPDGTSRTGHTLVEAGLKAGTPVTVWEDSQGRLALSRPTGQAEGDAGAALFGAGAALAVAAPVYGAGALARARLDRRRLARWEQEWDLVGPQWGPRAG